MIGAAWIKLMPVFERGPMDASPMPPPCWTA